MSVLEPEEATTPMTDTMRSKPSLSQLQDVDEALNGLEKKKASRKVSIKESKDVSPSLSRKNTLGNKDGKNQAKRETKAKKSFSKEKQAMMREYFVNSDNLTENQKLYEPRPGPKHFNPNLAEQRLKVLTGKLPTELQTTQPRRGSTLRRQ